MPHPNDPTRSAHSEKLLSRMKEEMALRGFARGTKRLYLAHTRRFLEAQTDAPESALVHRWLLSLLESGHSNSYVGQALSAVRFFYAKALEKSAPVVRLPRPKRKKRLPRVLAAPVVKRFLEALEGPKHRAIAFVLYASGLRVGEVVRLKVSDIDSDRMMIHVRDGKGGKDRYVMLSPALLAVLREYAAVERPHDWLVKWSAIEDI